MDQQGQFPHTRRQLTRRAKLVGTGIAVVLLAALGGLAWHLTHPDTPAGPGGAPGAAGPGGPGGAGGRGGGRGGPATTVGVATAVQADLPVILDALGTVTASATVTVRAQVSGVLQKISFKEGELVKAGQVLATIDPRQFEMALMQASGQLQRDEAQLDNARLTLQRYKTLLGQDSIARQDVDTQAALVKQLEGTIMTDRAAQGTAKLNLGYTKIVAPVGGRVGLRVVDVGNVVGTGDANGVALITKVSPIDVEFALPQDRVPELQTSTGSGADLPVITLDRTRTTPLGTGRFLALDNQVDAQTGTVRAKARFTNDKLNLFPSQFVNVRLTLRTITGAVVVPVTALRHGSSGDFVYVLNAQDRTVALRPVTRGQATVDTVQIATGLQAGEKVITEGADRLKDGSKVTLQGDKPMAGGAGGAGGGKGRRQRPDGAGGAAGAAPGGAPAAGAPAAAGASGSWSGRRRDPAAQDGAAPAATAPAAAASAAASAASADGAPREHRRRAQSAPAS